MILRRLPHAISALIRVGIGWFFLVSSVTKLQQPYRFLHSVYDYELAGPLAGLIVAFVVPWLELVLGLSLALGLFERGALLLTAVLLAGFTGARYLVVARGLPIGCGCLGNSSGIVGWPDVALTGGLFLATSFALGIAFRSVAACKESAPVAPNATD